MGGRDPPKPPVSTGGQPSPVSMGDESPTPGAPFGFSPFLPVPFRAFQAGRGAARVLGCAMIVMKFGGSSVANREQIEKVLGIVRGRSHRRPLVVSSAHKGMTDALVGAAHEAARGVFAPQKVIERQAKIAL